MYYFFFISYSFIKKTTRVLDRNLLIHLTYFYLSIIIWLLLLLSWHLVPFSYVIKKMIENTDTHTFPLNSVHVFRGTCIFLNNRNIRSYLFKNDKKASIFNKIVCFMWSLLFEVRFLHEGSINLISWHYYQTVQLAGGWCKHINFVSGTNINICPTRV